MKRGLLIAGGALGGLGAVMAITPPQLGSTNSMSIAGGTAIGVSTSAPSATTTATAPAATAPAAPAATKKATATKTATATATKKATATKTAARATTAAPAPAATTAAPAPAATTAAPAPAKGVTGSFVGPSVFVQYGNVQVEVTLVDGRITDAKAVIAPSGKNDRYTNMAVPVLKKQTLAAQSANIQGASGASYTSYGWFKSLQGALAKAGL